MAPSFLIVGATGNTGRATTSTLSDLLKSSPFSSSHRIIALTRSASSPSAQSLSSLPKVEVLEQNWTEITPSWLREHQVERAFIASHLQPNQFAEESTFHLAARDAGVKYIVRISTTAANVRPDCPAYYPRQHWAIETMLSTPEFADLHWSSLQPNVFSTLIMFPAAALVNEYHKTGKQGTLRLLPASDSPIGIIDPDDIGIFAAHLLAQEDISKHNHAKYVLNGPEDITGNQIVEMVKEKIGRDVENVVFKDMSFLDGFIATTKESKNVLGSIRHAPETAWEGLCKAETTSKEVLEIAAPKRTPRQVFEDLLKA